MKPLNVFVLIPTALKQHTSHIFGMWEEKGYKLGLFVDPHMDSPCDLLIRGTYPGVWNAWNALSKAAVSCGADVCVLVGDDMEPDPTHSAQEIGALYLERFPKGEGVIQPCGDPQGLDDSGRPAAARICGSPIIGRDWIKRAYNGDGPVNGTYNAFYADEELYHIASRSGKLALDPTLSHFHRHWSWGHLPRQPYHERNQTKWAKDKQLFEIRLADGFSDWKWL